MIANKMPKTEPVPNWHLPKTEPVPNWCQHLAQNWHKGEINLSKLKKITIALVTILIIVLVAIGINKQMIKILYKREYSEYVVKYSRENDVDQDLIYAIIKAESNFNASAISTSNAQGLMQLMYSTAEDVARKNGIELTKENILNPEINIEIGTIYISTLLEKYGCLEIALAAYNAGSGNVDKWISNGTIKKDGSDIENIPFKETNTYVRKILRDYKIYQQNN